MPSPMKRSHAEDQSEHSNDMSDNEKDIDDLESDGNEDSINRFVFFWLESEREHRFPISFHHFPP